MEILKIIYLTLTLCFCDGQNPDVVGTQCVKTANGTDCKTSYYRVNNPDNDDNAFLRPEDERDGGLGDPYADHGKYGLVPPFLIGASVVIVLYIILHCLYLHCYAKKTMQNMARSMAGPPSIIIHDDPSTASYQPMTPVLKFNGPFGDSQPYWVYQSNGDTDPKQQNNQQVSTSVKRKKSLSLHVPKVFRRDRQRASVCSAGPVMESSGQSSTNDIKASDQLRPARASICFVPVGRTVSDPSAKGWTPLQGFIYQGPSLHRNKSYSAACTPNTAASASSDDNPSAAHTPMFFFPSNNSASFVPNTSQTANDTAEEGGTSSGSNRGGSFKQDVQVKFAVGETQVEEEDDEGKEET